MASFEGRIISANSEGLEAAIELWNLSRHRNLAQHPEYVHKNTSHPCETVGVFDANRLVLAVSFSVLKRKGLTYWNSPSFSSFSGPLVHSAITDLTGKKAERFWRDALVALHNAVPASVDSVELIFSPGVNDLRELAWKGWSLRPHYNYLTQWESDGDWRSELSSSARRQEKKARESLIIKVTYSSQTKQLERLWQENAARQKLNPELSNSIGQLGDWLEEKNWGFVIEIHDKKDEVHAAALIGHDEHRAYYLAGASSPEHLGSGAPTLLQTAVLEEIEKRGLPRCYDWVGANTPNVVRFKQGFGPELEVLLAARRLSKKARFVDAGRQLLR